MAVDVVRTFHNMMGIDADTARHRLSPRTMRMRALRIVCGGEGVEVSHGSRRRDLGGRVEG